MKFEYNRIFYNTNCFDEERGLPRIIRLIEEGNIEKFELGITDPSYNEDYDTTISPVKRDTIKNYEKRKKEKKAYLDTIPNYKDFSLKWLDLMLQACEGVMFTCGTRWHYDWIRWKQPTYHEKLWYKTNACSYIKAEPILFYGKIKNYSSLRQVIEVPMNVENEVKTEHSTPKPLGLYEYILKKTQPKSVLDCFIGSGTVGHACLNYRIPFIGFDKGDYRNDWNDRLKEVKPIKKQKNIGEYFK